MEDNTEEESPDGENSSHKDRVQSSTSTDNQIESPPLLGFNSAREPVHAVLVVSNKPGDCGTPISQGLYCC